MCGHDQDGRTGPPPAGGKRSGENTMTRALILIFQTIGVVTIGYCAILGLFIMWWSIYYGNLGNWQRWF